MDSLKIKMKALAIYQIIGGLMGFYLMFQFFNSGSFTSILLLLAIPFTFALYGYSIYSGVILLKNTEKGLILSKINQFLQLISFVAFGYAYQFISGAYLLVGINLTNSLIFNFNFGVVSRFQISMNAGSPDLELSVNLIAILFVVFIDKAQQKLKSVDPEQQFSFENVDGSVELPNKQTIDINQYQ